MSTGLFPFVMDAVATVARSLDFHREMFGCERLQKIPRVEDLRRRADSLSLEITVKDARGSFDNDRRRDRVNVAPSRNGAALLAVAPRDDFHQKNLRRTSALIRRLRPGCVGIAQVADGRDVKISADLRCAQVPRHRDEVDGGKFAYDFLAAKWRRKFPPRSRYLVTRRKHFDSAILKNNAASGSALTGQACSACWLPAVERNSDGNVIRFCPIAECHGGEKVAQSTVECHRRHQNNVRIPHAF